MLPALSEAGGMNLWVRIIKNIMARESRGKSNGKSGTGIKLELFSIVLSYKS